MMTTSTMTDSELLEHIADSFSSHLVATNLLGKDTCHVSFDVPKSDSSAYVGHVYMTIEDNQIRMLVNHISHESHDSHRKTTIVPPEYIEKLHYRYMQDVVMPVTLAAPDKYEIAMHFPDLNASDVAVFEDCEVSRETAEEIYRAGAAAAAGTESSYADPTFDEWWREQVIE